ncbi:VrrA/YqfQ family protein [Lentibacillus sp.]|uniref:VrrA/YqfQ family protein n=1 Tax=Lentibacillus sp. TaxID=1925746 RepID=UPI002B4B508E|nr:VrrA/YqfQ family protein [Lentibacillus sp.]HLS09998.1 VrrA/YqfQ family protein [Lentibacillus sp.]
MVWPIQQQRPTNVMPPRQGFLPGRPPQQPSSGGIKQWLSSQTAQNLLSPERISGFSQKLNNVQQVLKVVQSAAPIVKQYGPMVKNLPALISMMKALNESNYEIDDEDTDADQSDHKEEDSEIPDAETEIVDLAETDGSETVKSGESTPKLFV